MRKILFVILSWIQSRSLVALFWLMPADPQFLKHTKVRYSDLCEAERHLWGWYWNAKNPAARAANQKTIIFISDHLRKTLTIDGTTGLLYRTPNSK